MKRVLTLCAVLLVAGCATTAAPPDERDPADPWEPFNRNMYAFNRGLDRAIVRPVARGYVKATPEPVRDGIGNFLTNIRYPVVILNLLLQGRGGDAGRALERFVFNTTAGVLGFFDFASHAGMPRYDEDFGQTFAVWGWEDSRYLVLPLLGPSTVRDGLGQPFDAYTNFIWRYAVEETRYVLLAVNVVHLRARFLPQEDALEDAFDEYIFVRDAWLQRREHRIREGETELPDYEEFLEDDWDEGREDF